MHMVFGGYLKVQNKLSWKCQSMLPSQLFPCVALSKLLNLTKLQTVPLLESPGVIQKDADN